MVTLESSRLFQQLTPEELKALRFVTQERSFPAGQPIFSEGDVGDGLYVVKGGLVEISAKVGPEAGWVSMAKVGPGDFFGEMAVLDYKRRSAKAVAVEATTTYFIPRLEVLSFIERSPVLAMTLLREISNRLRSFSQQHVRAVVHAERFTLLGRFAQSIIHDLKNPLSIIGLSAELAAADRTPPDSRKKALSVVRRQVERINDMVGDILDFTRGEANQTVTSPLPYGEFVRQVVADARSESALKSVVLTLCEPVTSHFVAINPKRMSRVFMNLFHNAIDFMPDGGEIFIRVVTAAKEIITEVEDTGPGISPEVAQSLFEPFATHGKAHGTGLGLSICRKTLADHRGWIQSVSQHNKGAIFRFGLPLWEPESAAPASRC